MAEETSLKDENIIKDLLELNEELENYFQSTIIPQLFFDKNLILRKYSPAALRQFNLKETDIGKHLRALSNNMLHSTLEEDINFTMSTRQVIEKEIQTTDEKWCRMNVVPYVQRKDNRTNGVILTFVDINNYVLTLKDLEKVNSEHELFIYTVSHDLVAPLHNIDGLVESLSDSINKNNLKERDQIIGMLKTTTAEMKGMITELTKISRVRAKKSENKTLIKFEDILDEVMLTLKEKIDESHAQIKSDFQITEINFLRKDIRSLLYNLVSNAIKYRSPDRGLVIYVKTQIENDFIVLSVKDNGRGIEEANKEIIFSQFTRIIEDVEGTGIGLYLVSKIANSNSGKIIVNSKVNEGSEFNVYLKAI